jgi:hypothetical protein
MITMLTPAGTPLSAVSVAKFWKRMSISTIFSAVNTPIFINNVRQNGSKERNIVQYLESDWF